MSNSPLAKPTVFDGDDIERLHDCRLGGVLRGEYHALEALFRGAHGHREGALHGPDGAVEGEFAGHRVIAELPLRDEPSGGEYSHGDGQVVDWPFFFNVGGGEIYRELACSGELVAGVPDGGLDAVAAFLDARVRHADDDDHGKVRMGDVYLDLEHVGVDALDGAAEDLG
jgi:hypothetical protein